MVICYCAMPPDIRTSCFYTISSDRMESCEISAHATTIILQPFQRGLPGKLLLPPLNSIPRLIFSAPLLPGYPRGHGTSLRSLATSICTLNVVCIWTYRLVYFSNRSIYRLCSSWIRLFCPRFWAFNRPHFPSNVVQKRSLLNHMRHWHRAKLPGSAASFTNPGSSARLCDSNSCIWLYPESCHKYWDRNWKRRFPKQYAQEK
jgi:hypothetical protein